MATANLYNYTVELRDRSIQTGRIKAPTEELARHYLADNGMIPLKLEKVETSGLNAELNINIGGRTKPQDVAIWAKNFSVMFDAGLSVTKILAVLEDQTQNQKLANITGEVRRSVENGARLADSMQDHVSTFSPMVVNMVRAGEASGDLDKTMRRISNSLDADVRLRKKIKSAMTYPVVVLIMAVVMTIAMLIFIVPTFESMFESLGGELPLPTQMLVTASDILKTAFIPIAIVIGIAVAWWRKNKNADWIRNIVDPLKLKIPVFGKLFQMVAISRFTRNLGTLLASGVSIIKALDIVSETTGSVVVSRAVDDVKDSVSKGKTFSGPLSQHEIFPTMVVQMVAVGEDAGNIEEMLEKVSGMYDDDVESMTESLTSLIEPLMIAFLGIVVGGMIIALYLPIFSVMDLIK